MHKISPIIALLTILFLSCEQPNQAVKSIKDDVQYLASDKLTGRETGTAGEKEAADYIVARMKEIGLTPGNKDRFIQVFDFYKKTNPHEDKIDSTQAPIQVHNVLGLIDHQAERTIIIGAHYDHLGHGISGSLHAEKDSAIHNGADDNASGIALLLQLADRIQSHQELSSNYLFIAFSGEEMGLLGSNYFAKNPSLDLSNVNYMLNFDMVGRLDTTKGLAINGVGTTTLWKQELERANRDNLNLIYGESGVGPSDHTSFYLQNIPVLHFFTGQHEDYHKPTDDVEKLNFKGIQTISDLIYRLVVELDGAKRLEFIKTKDERGKTPRWTVSLGVMPDYMFQGKGMRIDGISEGKPASVAGFKKGDIVVRMDTLAVEGMQTYMKGLSMFKKGDSTKVTVIRGEKLVEKMVFFK